LKIDTKGTAEEVHDVMGHDIILFFYKKANTFCVEINHEEFLFKKQNRTKCTEVL
jgi:peroxiredoxin